MENCAGCHGDDAKGAGPLSAKLKVKPPDLTLLAKRNHGSFDSAAVYQMIDGRNARATHRGAEMPIWGCRHEPAAVPAPPALSKHHRKLPKRVVSAMKRRESELDSLLDLPCGSEDTVRDRILSIVDYLSALREVIRETRSHKNGQVACHGVRESGRGVVTALHQPL